MHSTLLQAPRINPLMQRGFSIVELMVAVAISLMLTMGVIALFVSSRTNYETTERLSRIQENGRYALDQIVADVREAGFQGCARPNLMSSRADDFAITTLVAPTTVLWNFAVPVQGYQSNADGTWTPALDPLISGLVPDSASDVLVVRAVRRDEVALRLNTAQVTGADPLNVSAVAASTVAAGDVVMISDCEARAYFEVTNYAGGVVTHAATGRNASSDLEHPFGNGSEIMPVVTMIYYLAPSTADATRPSLWRRAGANAAEELAEGIERLEFQYGVDAGIDGRVDQYVSADLVTNWANVVSVRTALLARSPQPYGTDLDPQQYTLLERMAGPFNDRYQRQIFTSTVALRNLVID